MHVNTVTIAKALFYANAPKTVNELSIAVGRRVGASEAQQLLNRWMRAGMVRETEEFRSPETDLPGAWPAERKLRCYEYTDLGRAIYLHYSKLRKRGKLRRAMPV